VADDALETAADEAEQTKKYTDENPREAGSELDHGDVMKRHDRAWNYDRDNIDAAYADLAFLAGEQWDEDIRQQRISDSRPVLTFNRMGQFVRQVTGDMRQMRPSIKVVPVDDGADDEIAEIRSGLIRYIELRSDAQRIYTAAADSQVAAGIGHWEVFSEYADDSTFEQELGIRLLDDQISVLWDPDAKHPTRKDAMYCFCPVDLTRDAYEASYPDHAVSDMGTNSLATEWFADDRVRIARYWYKVKIKRRLMTMPNGGYEDLTGADPGHIAKLTAEGGKLVERDGHKVRWVMLNGAEFISEPKDWPGRFIPVVPLIGEEIRVGSKIHRHGIIRFAADPQRAYNYARSTQTEFVGLQPKAPFLGTEENFKDYEDEWNLSNVKNWPFLRYKPDPKNGGAPPRREAPPSNASGLTECVMMAEQDMQAVIGIYNASLGAKSNETSGVAIQKRERQGDVGTYVYMDNFALSITHTARVLNDLIPHYYDSSRTVRVLGVDGSERRVPINQPQGLAIGGAAGTLQNDITAGAYDVQMEMGPSYATKREEAREGMTAFVQAFPPAGPLIADLIAKAQDWPNAEAVADRLFHVLPPNLQAEIAQKSGDPSKMPQQQPPDPMMVAQAQAEMAKAEGEKAKAFAATAQGKADVQLADLKIQQQQLLNVKTEFELLDAQMKLGANGPPIDIEQLREWASHVDMSLQMLDQHAASSILGGGGELPEMPAAPEGVGGEPQAMDMPPEAMAPPGAGPSMPLEGLV